MSLRLEGVAKRYGSVVAVDGVSLELPPATTLALLGPSGCGKSTLLRLIAGLEAPDAGTVALDGVDLAATPPAKRRFGMVFQDYALFPYLDVAGNVAFGLVEARVPAQRRAARVADLLELVGLAGFERRKVDELSGGQRQRVALARALAPEPRLLLLDEPLSNLDAKLREALKFELRGILAGLPTGAVYVTHDQGEAFTVADRVALMREGRIVQVGEGEELIARPANAWAARFLGHDNVFEGAEARRLPLGTDAALLRADLTRLVDLQAGAIAATVTGAVREGLEWRLSLAVPAWGVTVAWRGFERELLPEPPAPGRRYGLQVPAAAWQALEGDA